METTFNLQAPSTWLAAQDNASQDFDTLDWPDYDMPKPPDPREIGMLGTIVFLGGLVAVQTAINLLAMWSAQQ